MSNTDSRSTHTDALDTLGKIIGDAEKRDAVHIAVEPMTALRSLRPGEHVKPDGDPGDPGADTVGIVDPYLPAGTIVAKGQRFWCLLYPRQIKSLRHVWTHPAFPDEAVVGTPATFSKSASERWLREFSEERDISLDRIMGAAISDDNHDEYLIIRGEDASGSIPSELWDHIENVTGKSIRNRPTYFSCSC